MIRDYLQLFRIPGIFTVFSNILLGFFFVQDVITQWTSLFFLLTTSGFLFLSGMILNDFFDYNIDKKERPERSLVSGKIRQKHAFLLGIVFMSVANLFAFFVSTQALIISLLMSGLIFSYDIKLKNISILGILTLSLIRFLNIFLGASIVLSNKEIILLGIPLAIFVAGISMLAKYEVSIPKYVTLSKIVVIITILFVAVIVINENISYNVIFLLIFAILAYIPFIIFNNKSNQDIKKIVTIQLLNIIILDATLIATFSEILFAIITLSLYIPAYFFSKKICFT